MVATRPRPLPGIRFEAVAIPPGDDLPRMDIPVFVGFASRGPLHRARAFEDVAGFEAVFGPDRILAWDAATGQPVTSWLGPAVRAFFANGGRRCWVVRIASPSRRAATATRPASIDISPRLFLDPDLETTGREALLARASYIRYEAPRPRRLRGIHAALEVEEAKLIAVPDVLHLAERLRSTPPPPAMAAAEAKPAGDDGFRACPGPALGVPDIVPERLADDPHAVRIRWTSPGDGAVDTVVEETVLTERGKPVPALPAIVYAGPPRDLVVLGRSTGELRYRARFEREGAPGAWSAPVTVASADRPGRSTVAPTGWIVPVSVDAARMAGLRAVQTALLELCAARGDLFAVLGMPGHLRERDAIRHVARLRAGDRVDPALGYGAVYHPWLVGLGAALPGEWSAMPPDGAMCGLIARRAAERGAWIAPANDLLNGVVALSPALPREARQGLQDANINVIRREPRGFLTLGADTLSADPDRRPIGVRRLLALLRRLALDRGMTYVFEPNTPAFRRRVEIDFATLLGRLYRLGAFAGDSPATSYRVVTDETVNTTQAVDQGRFVVELRVAPSLPLRFLAVRLVHAPDRGLLLEEGQG
jgi:hypothetical protein